LVDPETCRHLAEVQALATDRGIWIDVPVNFAFGLKRAEWLPRTLGISSLPASAGSVPR